MAAKQGLYRYFALSDRWPARFARTGYRALLSFSLPAPRFVTRPLLAIVVLIRSTYLTVARIFWCEPLFKAYCKSYGKGLHTGSFLHWIQGTGDIIIGDNVTVDGRSAFFFAVRYSANPSLIIGDGTAIGHGCSFTVGERITIGKNCRIAANIHFFDSGGHPSHPERRLAGEPADVEDVRPITVGDNVWIGSHSAIYPGVTIGDNSVVSLGSVVMSNVPANAIVAGNPARQIRSLAPAPPAPK